VKMDLIQPFINATDAVLAETLQCTTSIGTVSMEQEAYCLHGVAALIVVQGDIEGRIIFDLEPEAAKAVTQRLAGGNDSAATPEMVREAICELANQVIGNAVTVLNDQGFHFKVHPPEIHTASHGGASSEDTEALVMCFDTSSGMIFMNIAMRYNHRRKHDSVMVG